MKKIRILAAFGSLVVLLAASGPSLAQDSQKGVFRNILVVFMPPTPEEERKIATTVGLSEEQREQAQEVNQRYRANAATLRGKYAAAYEDVVKLMQQTSPDKSVVNTKLKAFHSMHQKVVEHEVGYWTDFKSILTPEQNKKLWNVFEQSRVRG